MAFYVIICPNCKQPDCFEKDKEFESNKTFECECGEEFTLSGADLNVHKAM